MDFNALMQQASMMAKNMENEKNQFDDKVFPFSAKSNMIHGEMNGKGELLSLHIDQALLEDHEMLEDMLLITINKCIKDIESERKKTLGQVTNGLDVSSFL